MPAIDTGQWLLPLAAYTLIAHIARHITPLRHRAAIDYWWLRTFRHADYADNISPHIDYAAADTPVADITPAPPADYAITSDFRQRH